jgi:hypothetical protein
MSARLSDKRRLAKAAVHVSELALALGIAQIAKAQTSPPAYTAEVRFDVAGRKVGTIAPDPDGSGLLKFAAVRNTPMAILASSSKLRRASYLPGRGKLSLQRAGQASPFCR